MHELRIAKDLSEIVLDAASRERVSAVTRVNIVFGEMVQIVPAIFETAFRECVRGTAAEKAELVFEILPVSILCRECRQESIAGKLLFRCSLCGSPDLDVIQGNEMFVKTIEAE
jgi:hydrogenase nickel incorporation protein HypA/HybF